MKRLLFASLLALTGAANAGPPSQIDVMTQNQYLGADLVPIVQAGAAVPFDPVAFNAAVVNALAQVAANLPEQRYQALGREILFRHPEVVGLQEVFEFSCTPPPAGDPNLPPGNGCNFGPIAGAFNDHLQGTLDATYGMYVAKAVVQNLNITLPIVTPVGGAYVTVVDRDAILVRRDVAKSASVVPYGASCAYPSVDGCNYDIVAETTIAGQTVRIERGFVGIDLRVGKSAYRVVNTHLEVRDPDPGNPASQYFQAMQAYQLAQTVSQGLTGQKLIVVGDFNSAPVDMPYGPIVPPYMQFAAAGFTDAWTMRPGAMQGQGAPLVGYSCCQLEDLSNKSSMLYERIDLVWSLTKPSKVLDARLIGTTPAFKTWPPGQGVWPSDHAAVAATLRY
ncbi:MAG: hypothetical protein U1F09_02050 [Steroidobacteraceae bacterium]